ncbi:MAG: SDR family oxidoreductase [Actinomycetota bacterium]|nr:SDR family oxidoreductase [Actinomycetota bacterium]
MTEDGRVALVSGANRGIGREVVRQLAEKGITTILGSRDEEKGSTAAEGMNGNVVVKRLDVIDEDSVYRLASFVEDEFGQLDILINNAGIANDSGQRGVDADLDSVREALEANLFGAWRLCEAFVPLMQRNGYGRIVNISSGMGALNDMGGGSPAYRVSKTALNALTRILASELRGSGILVNSVSPGWVRTDMGGSDASRSVEEGADTPIWAATLPDNGPTGGFFRDRRPVSW